jgi:hypothetical protein
MGQSATLTPPCVHPTSRTGESQCTDEANTSQQGDSVSGIIIPPQIQIHVQTETVLAFPTVPLVTASAIGLRSLVRKGKGIRNAERGKT